MTTLCAFLDLAVCPASFDAVVFAARAALAQRETGATRMHLCLVGEMRQKPQQYDEHEGRWRLWNIVVPAANLFGATVTLAADWGQAERIAAGEDSVCWPEDWRHQTLKNRHHLVGPLIAAARAGKQIPRARPSHYARQAVRQAFEKFRRPVVTMTLRSTYLPERNSDPAEWDAAQRHIEARGFSVVRLEDTRVALRRGSGFGELNLDLRAAMYQEAAMNLQANNGASSLCWFSDRPYRMFGAGVPAGEWDGLFVRQGLPLGAQWPWADEQQQIVYGKETRATIIDAFESWNQTREIKETA